MRDASLTMPGQSIRRLLALAILMFVVSPASASASWGKENGHSCGALPLHCYAITTWHMEGSEKVEGSLAYQDTTTMNVFGWANGEYVSNEEWALFQPKEWWVEVGQEAGGNSFTIKPGEVPFSCCLVHSFYGWENGSGFHSYAAPWGVGDNEENIYQLAGNAKNGTWCPYFDKTQAQCISGFPVYSNELQAGGEYYDNIKPANAAHVADNAWWTDGSIQNWNFDEMEHGAGLCTTRYTLPYPAAGNINYGTC
jgi:hypothetical protein